jgi:hypothetical protein
MGDTLRVCAGTQTGPGRSATMNTSNMEHPLPRTEETIMNEQDHTTDSDTDTDDTEGNHFSRGRIQPADDTDDVEGNHFGRGRLTPADGADDVEGNSLRRG